MQEAILETLGTLQRCIQLISIQDLIDMGIIAYVIYRGMKLLKGQGHTNHFCGTNCRGVFTAEYSLVDLTAGLLVRCLVPRNCLSARTAPYAGTAR